MDRIKLVLFSAFYEPYMSGAEQMVKEIAEKMGDKYDITIITGRYNRINPKREKKSVFRIIRVGIGNKQLDKLLYIFLAPLRACRIKPDIVHAVMESYAGAALVMLKYFYSPAKRILTLQSGDLDDNKKQSVFYIRFFWRIIHRSPHIITAISSALAARAEKLGVKKENIYITPNGLDFSTVPRNIIKIKNRVICVGRLSWEKAHQYTLAAWQEIIKEIPDAKLVLAGEGPERKNIEKKIKELNIEESVSMTGNLPHAQVLEELSKSEVFICPSLAEGLGNVFIEAQACGTPPIGTNIGGIPDIIRHKKNGLLIAPKNSAEIKKAILILLRDKELAKRLAIKGLETSQRFEWKRIIKKIDFIYNKILN